MPPDPLPRYPARTAGPSAVGARHAYWAGHASAVVGAVPVGVLVIRQVLLVLASLRSRWETDEISDELFFSAVRPLEDRFKHLGAEQAKHALAAERVSQATATDISELRARWYKD
jgi:hypothetical protein